MQAIASKALRRGRSGPQRARLPGAMRSSESCGWRWSESPRRSPSQIRPVMMLPPPRRRTESSHPAGIGDADVKLSPAIAAARPYIRYVICAAIAADLPQTVRNRKRPFHACQVHAVFPGGHPPGTAARPGSGTASVPDRGTAGGSPAPPRAEQSHDGDIHRQPRWSMKKVSMGRPTAVPRVLGAVPDAGGRAPLALGKPIGDNPASPGIGGSPVPRRTRAAMNRQRLATSPPGAWASDQRPRLADSMRRAPRR